jgi:hypothetical protein
MVRTKYVLSIVGVILLSAGITWAGPKMNPGKWEITTKTEMAGMPAQSITHTQCITSDDLVPMSDDANQNCQVKNMKTSGNTVTWEITCGGQGGQMDGTGEVTYNGDTMEGKMEMKIQGMDMKVKNTLSGKRIGQCDGQSSSPTFSSAPQPSASQDTAPDTTSEEPSKVEETIEQDAKDVGKAGKDEAKQSTVDEVRKGVRGFFKKVFD